MTEKQAKLFTEIIKAIAVILVAFTSGFGGMKYAKAEDNYVIMNLKNDVDLIKKDHKTEIDLIKEKISTINVDISGMRAEIKTELKYISQSLDKISKSN